ncbi:MAG: sigma-70 family RNA polymerase sigma factor [Oscillospiraceae bacterium]|nr:sigma-70 family RNA polymerase sigma factor [Oscillospiraceae bacterium]
MTAHVVLSDTIRAVQNGDGESLLLLLKQFEPILNKYAWKLNLDYDDAKQEMLLVFIALINSMILSSLRDSSNKALVSYIAKSVHNAYIHISKKNRSSQNETSLEDSGHTWEARHFSSDAYMGVYIAELKTVLTEREFQVFQLHYLEDKPIDDMATKLGVSRQNINQIKLKAIRKLKEFYRKDDLT